MKVTKKQYDALKDSIVRWAVARNAGVLETHECPCCASFPSCEGCPISEATEIDDCYHTPWSLWGFRTNGIRFADALLFVPKGRRLNDLSLMEVAGIFADWLQNLLAVCEVEDAPEN